MVNVGKYTVRPMDPMSMVVSSAQRSASLPVRVYAWDVTSGWVGSWVLMEMSMESQVQFAVVVYNCGFGWMGWGHETLGRSG